MPQAPEDRTGLDLESMQAAYLNRFIPGHRRVRVRWSGGTTQVIEAGHGRPLLLIHGGLGEAFQWAPLFPLLARSYRVLAVDRPGHGLADPFDYRGVDLLAFGARFIGEVLDALGLRTATILGNSMGALWATGFALTFPERVSQLIPVGSPAGVQRAVPFQLRLATVPVLRSIVEAGMARPSRDGVRSFWKLLVAHPERLENDFLDLTAASQLRNYRSWMTLLHAALGLRGMQSHLLLHERWANVRPSTTFVWGEKDAFSPPSAGEAIAAAHPRFRIIRVTDAGHVPWFDDAPAVARAIENALAGMTMNAG